MDDIEKKIINYIDKNKNEYISFLQKLLKIPSLTGEEKDAQVFVSNTLKKQGFSVEMFEPDVKELFEKYPQIAQIPSSWIPEYDMPLKTKDVFTYSQLMESKFDKVKTYKNRPNVVATLRGTGGGKSLILNGHIDVVTIGDKAKWKYDPWGAEIKDGKMYARGASDMKGGIAAIIKAMEAIIKSGIKLSGDVLVQSVVNEEHAGNGALACVAKGYTADAAIITESSGYETVVTESGGGVYWEIKLKGRETHAACRWQGKEQYGVSSIEKTPLIINKLLEMEQTLNKKEPNISLCIGMIKGGTYSTSTALECTLNGVAYFSANLGTGDEGIIKVKNLLKECVKNINDPWLKSNPPEILFQHYDDAYKMGDSGKEILAALMGAGKEVIGKNLKIDKMGACDARSLGNKGKIPVIVYGPGTVKTAHSLDENITIEDYLKAIKVLAITIYRWSK